MSERILFQDKNKATVKLYITLFISICITLTIGSAIMPFGQVTNVGMRILGVFAGCIFV